VLGLPLWRLRQFGQSNHILVDRELQYCRRLASWVCIDSATLQHQRVLHIFFGTLTFCLRMSNVPDGSSARSSRKGFTSGSSEWLLMESTNLPSRQWWSASVRIRHPLAPNATSKMARRLEISLKWRRRWKKTNTLWQPICQRRYSWPQPFFESKALAMVRLSCS
jgi:hypothetical protein